MLALVDGILMLTARGLTRGAVNAVLQPDGLLREGNGAAQRRLRGRQRRRRRRSAACSSRRAASSTALAVDAASFAVIAVLLATRRHLPAAASGARAVRRSASATACATCARTVARLLVGGEALAIVFFTLIVPIEVVYAEETLAPTRPATACCWPRGAPGVVLGSVLFLAVRRRSAAPLILLSTLAIGVAYLGMAVARELWRRARSRCSAASATASSGCRS